MVDTARLALLKGYTHVVDWRALLVALADSYFGFFLSKSSLEDIVQARVG